MKEVTGYKANTLLHLTVTSGHPAEEAKDIPRRMDG